MLFRFYEPLEPFFAKTWKPDNIIELKGTFTRLAGYLAAHARNHLPSIELSISRKPARSR